jgi:hypothetical protein
MEGVVTSDGGKALEIALAHTGLAKMGDGVDEVIEIGAGNPVGAANLVGLDGKRQDTDITRVTAFDNVGEGDDFAVGAVE